jgi:hypothetical protein
MSIRDQLAHDEETVLFDAGLDDTVEVWPDGDADASFPAPAYLGEAPEQTITLDHLGQGAQRRAQALILRAPVLAGMEAQTTTARDLRRGDELWLAAGEFAGLWVVETVTPTAGGNLDCALQYQRADRAHGRMVV